MPRPRQFDVAVRPVLREVLPIRVLHGRQRRCARREIDPPAVVGIDQRAIPELRALIKIRHARHCRLQSYLAQRVQRAQQRCTLRQRLERAEYGEYNDRAERGDYVDPASYRITTLHPRTYNEARTIGEHFRAGTPVIMNLSEMDDADAKRLVDFAAGLTFGLHGRIERVTAKVFLLSPHNVTVTAQDKAKIADGAFFNQS